MCPWLWENTKWSKGEWFHSYRKVTIGTHTFIRDRGLRRDNEQWVSHICRKCLSFYHYHIKSSYHTFVYSHCLLIWNYQNIFRWKNCHVFVDGCIFLWTVTDLEKVVTHFTFLEKSYWLIMSHILSHYILYCLTSDSLTTLDMAKSIHFVTCTICSDCLTFIIFVFHYLWGVINVVYI